MVNAVLIFVKPFVPCQLWKTTCEVSFSLTKVYKRQKQNKMVVTKGWKKGTGEMSVKGSRISASSVKFMICECYQYKVSCEIAHEN